MLGICLRKFLPDTLQEYKYGGVNNIIRENMPINSLQFISLHLIIEITKIITALETNLKNS